MMAPISSPGEVFGTIGRGWLAYQLPVLRT
jgi:hypothetical protein